MGKKRNLNRDLTYKPVYLDKPTWHAIAFIAREHHTSFKQTTRDLIMVGIQEYCKELVNAGWVKRVAANYLPPPESPNAKKKAVEFLRSIRKMLYPDSFQDEKSEQKTGQDTEPPAD